MKKIFTDTFVSNKPHKTMAKIQLDLNQDLHLDVKEYQVTLERRDKKKYSLKEVYEILINKGINEIKKQKQ